MDLVVRTIGDGFLWALQQIHPQNIEHRRVQIEMNGKKMAFGAGDDCFPYDNTEKLRPWKDISEQRALKYQCLLQLLVPWHSGQPGVAVNHRAMDYRMMRFWPGIAFHAFALIAVQINVFTQHQSEMNWPAMPVLSFGHYGLDRIPPSSDHFWHCSQTETRPQHGILPWHVPLTRYTGRGNLNLNVNKWSVLFCLLFCESFQYSLTKRNNDASVPSSPARELRLTILGSKKINWLVQTNTIGYLSRIPNLNIINKKIHSQKNFTCLTPSKFHI